MQDLENAMRIVSDRFDRDIYKQAGVMVLRNVIPRGVVCRWQDVWNEFQDLKLRNSRRINESNPVALMETLPGELATMYREPSLIDVMKQVHGQDVALYSHRFVIKDQFSRGKVFLHQDSCYQLGALNKCSLFVPLSIVNQDNGGLTFHVGSHRFGFLGDAGEINPDSFEIKWPQVTPELQPGDVVVMNSSVWHGSGPNNSGVDRILADMIVQPADDPTGIELLSGEWRTDIFYSTTNCIRYFNNSRVLRNLKYAKELENMKLSGNGQ